MLMLWVCFLGLVMARIEGCLGCVSVTVSVSVSMSVVTFVVMCVGVVDGEVGDVGAGLCALVLMFESCD